MRNIGTPGKFGLEHHGLRNLGSVYWNSLPPVLVEEAILRHEGELATDGSIVCRTGQFTGRSPKDKYIVRNPGESDEIWWGEINQPIEPNKFSALLDKVNSYFQGRDVFVQDMQAGAHPDHRLNIRVITEKAWASLFSHNLFRQISLSDAGEQEPQFTIIHAPDFMANPEVDGTRSGTFIMIDFSQRIILIGGTSYAGEIKKSVFTIMNYLLPHDNVLPMHCSANLGMADDVALFFGLSGTGKTTLSSDPERRLIGDDEHGWSDSGVFNFEGGCYAKTIRLRQDLEPMIWNAIHRFGTVLENVEIDPTTHELDFESELYTENTRAAYPLDGIPNHVVEGYAGHPINIFFLTADAFGVMPPISRLTPDQAMYYFLSGYTSKLAGTEKELGKEPQATFSTCFGAPFLPLPPHRYSDLLGKRIKNSKVNVWLINTGWIGGPYGVGARVKIPYTRAMVRAALTGRLNDVSFKREPHFGLWIPEACPEVPSEVLNPATMWKHTQSYSEAAKALCVRFVANFEQYAPDVSPSVVTSGPPRD